MSTPFDDPFAQPLVDLDTGEILDTPTTVEEGSGDPEARLVTGAVLAIRHPGLPPTFAGELGKALRAEVTRYAEELNSSRPPGRVTQASVAHEIEGLTWAHDTLADVGRAFTGAAGLARECLGELVLEVRGDRVTREGGSTSIKVGEPRTGGQAKVTVAQPTKTVVDLEAVVDVIVGKIVDNADDPHIETSAQAARDALDALLHLISPPSWKITALEAWRSDLEAKGDAAAVKLGRAYGKVPQGEPRATIEHITPKEPK